MSERMTLGSLFVLAALIPGICWAQGGYGNGGPPGNWQAPPQGSPYSGYPAPPAAPPTIYEQLPDDLGFRHEDSAFETALKNVFRHSYYRGEFLLWAASNPGDVVLGATPTGGYVTSTQLQQNPPLLPPTTFSIPNPIGTVNAAVVQPTLGDFNISNVPGYRGTFGLPIGPGNFELSAFVLGTRQNSYDGTSMITQEVPPNAVTGALAVPAVFIGQPINVPGSQIYNLYTDSYEAVLKTNIWGSEANYIMDAPNAGTGDLLTISPLIGFRYLNYLETFAQGGIYEVAVTDNLGNVTLTPNSRAIYSSSNNNSYGPQFGVRSELSISKVTFGAEPKIMLGLNSYTASVTSINAPFDGTNTTNHKKATIFSPVADLKLYTRVAVAKYAHVFAAYNVMWAGSLTRPYDSIGYNVDANGGGFFTPSFTDSIIQGLTVGGELRF